MSIEPQTDIKQHNTPKRDYKTIEKQRVAANMWRKNNLAKASNTVNNWQKAHREKTNQHYKNWKARPGNIEKALAATAEWQRNNPAKRATYMNTWYAKSKAERSYTCGCGLVTHPAANNCHKKTKTHQQYLEQQAKEQQAAEQQQAVGRQPQHVSVMPMVTPAVISAH